MVEVDHTKFEELRVTLLQPSTTNYFPQYSQIEKKKLDHFNIDLASILVATWAKVILSTQHFIIDLIYILARVRTLSLIIAIAEVGTLTWGLT